VLPKIEHHYRNNFMDSARWPALINAATFVDMQRNADRTAPDTDLDLWRDNKRFFLSGTSGKWRTELLAESLACYTRVISQREPAAMIRWFEEGSAAGDPKQSI
jgi:aryl sulfotransferase